MKQAAFKAFCPFEIGDEVNIKISVLKSYVLTDDVFIIDDILTIHSVKTGDVRFEISLKDEDGKPLSLNYPVERIHLVKKAGENNA